MKADLNDRPPHVLSYARPQAAVPWNRFEHASLRLALVSVFLGGLWLVLVLNGNDFAGYVATFWFLFAILAILLGIGGLTDRERRRNPRFLTNLGWLLGL